MTRVIYQDRSSTSLDGCFTLEARSPLNGNIPAGHRQAAATGGPGGRPRVALIPFNRTKEAAAGDSAGQTCLTTIQVQQERALG
jgi:hypothetical protein